MTVLSAEAEQRWADYLTSVQIELERLDWPGRDEVLNDLQVHFDDELADLPEPITAEDVNALISRLGSAEEITAHLDPQGTGDQPERSLGLLLPVASLALLVSGFLLPALFAGAIPLAAVLARVAIGKYQDKESSAFRLALPALISGYVLLALIILAAPLLPVLPLTASGGLLPEFLFEPAVTDSRGYWKTVWSTATIALGVWWLILLRVRVAQRKRINQIFFPFTPADWGGLKSALHYGAACLIVLGLLGIILQSGIL